LDQKSQKRRQCTICRRLPTKTPKQVSVLALGLGAPNALEEGLHHRRTPMLHTMGEFYSWLSAHLASILETSSNL